MVTGGAIPQADEKPNDCLFESRKICSSPNEINYMRAYLKAHKNPVHGGSENDLEVIKELMKLLNVDKESKIWEHPDFKKFVGHNKAEQVLKSLFKPVGPADSTALLDNFVIDATLAQWAKNSKKLFNCKFYHIPYQMIDFETVKSELAKLSLPSLLKEGYDCFGVVINTDISSGRGKHWFCLFGDFRHQGTVADPYTLEFFNSSGNPPVSEIQTWLEKSAHDLILSTHKVVEIVRAANIRIQHSNTECGVFSLMYIKSRLENHPPNWFYTVSADDRDMIKLRKHLFRKGKF